MPVSLGEVADDAGRRRRRSPSGIGGVTVVKAQVKIGGRGKAGGVKVAKTPGRGQGAAEAILGMDIKGHTVHRVLVDPGARDRAGVLRLLPARPRQPHVPRDGVLRGRHGDRAARGRAARRAGEGAGRRDRRRRRRRRPARSSPRRSSRAEVADKVADDPGEAVGRVRRVRRDAGRGEPAGQGGARATATIARARRQGDARRQRELPPAAATPTWSTSRRPTRSSRRRRRSTSTTSSSTVRSASSATARAWSCRRSTSSPTPARSTAA